MEEQKGAFRNKQISILIFLFSLWANGCALQADMFDLQKEVAEMRKANAANPQQVKEIEKALKERTLALQKTQVDLVANIGRLSSDLQVLQGRLEESEHKTLDLLKKIDDQIYKTKDLSARIDILEGRSLKGSNIPFKDKGGPSEEIGRSEGGDPDQKKAGSERQDKKTSVSPSEVYTQAYSDYLKGNYDLAVLGFQNYAAQFPNANQISDAYYWLGESFYKKKEYKKAIEAFEKLTKKYPKSEKVVSALLKEGYSYYELGDKEGSRIFLKRIIDEFPLSEEVKLAKEKLSEIK